MWGGFSQGRRGSAAGPRAHIPRDWRGLKLKVAEVWELGEREGLCGALEPRAPRLGCEGGLSTGGGLTTGGLSEDQVEFRPQVERESAETIPQLNLCGGQGGGGRGQGGVGGGKGGGRAGVVGGGGTNGGV